MSVLLYMTTRLAAVVPEKLGGATRWNSEDGFSTAELLANAALGVGALVVIWAAMNALGADVVAWIRSQLNLG